jgi:hypothetical protein
MVRPIIASKKEYSASSDQSQPLIRYIPHCPTNHCLSLWTFRIVLPITASHYEYSASSDQSKPPIKIIPHCPTNQSLPLETFRIVQPITASHYEYSASSDQSQTLNRNIHHHEVWSSLWPILCAHHQSVRFTNMTRFWMTANNSQKHRATKRNIP